ncbi:Uracil permease [compost metagenome]
MVLVVGISGTTLTMGNVKLSGMALATIVGIVLALFFKLIEVLGLSNDGGESDKTAH